MRFRVEMSNLASEQYDKFLAYIYLVWKIRKQLTV